MFLAAALDRSGRSIGEASTALVPWWSFTKTLIAASALRLAEDGRLSLDDPSSGRPYTLRQLLRHRAGVGNYAGLAAYHEAVARNDPPWRDEELFARVPPGRLLFAPDHGWAYSNVGYLLVRRVLETACGVGLGRILRDQILDPLDLGASRLAETSADLDATAFAGGRGLDPGWIFMVSSSVRSSRLRARSMPSRPVISCPRPCGRRSANAIRSGDRSRGGHGRRRVMEWA